MAQDDFIKINVEGLDKVQQALGALGQDLNSPAGLWPANQDVSAEILGTTGLQAYPPAGIANQPPTPYYIRGRGTQTAHGNRNNSERLGTQFTTLNVPYGAQIGNRASYAPYVIGKQRAGAMGAIGWRKLADVAQEKVSKITEIYQKHINRLIERLGLK